MACACAVIEGTVESDGLFVVDPDYAVSQSDLLLGLLATLSASPKLAHLLAVIHEVVKSYDESTYKFIVDTMYLKIGRGCADIGGANGEIPIQSSIFISWRRGRALLG